MEDDQKLSRFYNGFYLRGTDQPLALSDGLSNKAAAPRLGISPHTVKFHIEALFRKLDAGSRAEVVAKGSKPVLTLFIAESPPSYRSDR